eukprot:TRINITY_DN40952_c0_g1_i1.p2 TRINITY_DN40952_c0_g1~~TRINITY_DN40952_c0_g1_i1.p2  ORF type:complete len:143 (-),score=22.97 TRINITY_DN40952_c0_g1_i1:65-493(-)
MSFLAFPGSRLLRSFGSSKAAALCGCSSWPLRGCSTAVRQVGVSQVEQVLRRQWPLQEGSRPRLLEEPAWPAWPAVFPATIPRALAPRDLQVDSPQLHDVIPLPLECANRSPLGRVPKPANKGARPRCVTMKKLRKRARTGR